MWYVSLDCLCSQQTHTKCANGEAASPALGTGLEIRDKLLNQMSQCKKSTDAPLCDSLFQRQLCLDLCSRFFNFLPRVNWFCSHYRCFSRFSWSYQRKWLSGVATIWKISIPDLDNRFFFRLMYCSGMLFSSFYKQTRTKDYCS